MEQDLALYQKHKDEGVLENYELFIGKVKNFGTKNKEKVGALEEEINEIGKQIDQRQEEITKMKE